jgi:hypothetical protein
MSGVLSGMWLSFANFRPLQDRATPPAGPREAPAKLKLNSGSSSPLEPFSRRGRRDRFVSLILTGTIVPETIFAGAVTLSPAAGACGACAIAGAAAEAKATAVTHTNLWDRDRRKRKAMIGLLLPNGPLSVVEPTEPQ